MRKITKNAANAFAAGDEWKQDNTQVWNGFVLENGGIRRPAVWLVLHGNKIAERYVSSKGVEFLRITTAGWMTPTTKERLNALPGVSISQRKGVWYLNGQEWDGEWTTVGERPLHNCGIAIVPKFQAHIEYDADDMQLAFDAVDTVAFDFAKNNDALDVVSNPGGPAWYPYLTITGDSSQAVAEVVSAVLETIKRQPGHKIR